MHHVYGKLSFVVSRDLHEIFLRAKKVVNILTPVRFLVVSFLEA